MRPPRSPRPDGEGSPAADALFLDAVAASRADPSPPPPPPDPPSWDPALPAGSGDPELSFTSITDSAASTDLSCATTASLAPTRRLAFGPLGEYGMRSLPRGAAAPLKRKPAGPGAVPKRRKGEAMGVLAPNGMIGEGPSVFPDLKRYWGGQQGAADRAGAGGTVA